MKAYYEVIINPCHSGFGEYETNLTDTGECWEDESDLVSAMANGVDELIEITDGEDLPEGVVDIRTLTHHCPARVFACQQADIWTYHGIDTMELD